MHTFWLLGIAIYKNNTPLLQNKIVLGNIYRPPRNLPSAEASLEKFVNAIEPILTKLAKRNCSIVIAGDFNTNLLKINQSTQTNYLFSNFCSNDFIPRITYPTRLDTRWSSASLIDQIYVKDITLGNTSLISGIWLKKSPIINWYSPKWTFLYPSKKSPNLFSEEILQ